MQEQEHVVHVLMLIRQICHFEVIRREEVQKLKFFHCLLLLELNNHFARKLMYNFQIEQEREIQHHELEQEE